MSGTNIHSFPNTLEQILGFKMDCPRCRAWNLSFKDIKQKINIQCEKCGLELVINIESLVKYTGNILSLSF
jgi:transcription elongation factor Elf1